MDGDGDRETLTSPTSLSPGVWVPIRLHSPYPPCTRRGAIDGRPRRRRGKRRMLDAWSADGTEQLRHRSAGCSRDQKCEGNQFTALECCKLAADFKIASISAKLCDISLIDRTPA